MMALERAFHGISFAFMVDIAPVSCRRMASCTGSVEDTWPMVMETQMVSTITDSRASLLHNLHIKFRYSYEDIFGNSGFLNLVIHG